MSDIFVAHLELAFILAQQNHSKLNVELCHADGLSGIKTRHFYNNLCGINGVRNLHVSSWNPGLVCSSLCAQQSLTLTCISNFTNCDIRFKMAFQNQFNKYKNNANAVLLDTDYLKLDTTNLGKFNIYSYDGDHSPDSHVAALTHFYPVLDDIFIYVVEHWNWDFVRNGTFKSINDLKLNVIWGRDIRLTTDNTHTPINMAKETWWNGIGAFVLQKTSTPSASVIPVIEIAPSSELDSLLDSIANEVTTETVVENIDNTLLDESVEIPVAPAPTPTLKLTPTPAPKNKKKKKATK